MSTNGNSLLECPRCQTNTLIVVGSDANEANVGIRRYQCEDCRNRFTALEAFFLDDEGNEDCFLQLALNWRLHERENHERRTGKKPRRQLKPTDSVVVRQGHGTLAFTYHRSPRKKALFLVCKRGHELNDGNTYTNPYTKARTCLPCKRAYQRAWNKRWRVANPELAKEKWKKYGKKARLRARAERREEAA